MTPGHNRWFFAAFGAVAILVTGNAFLQPPRQAHLIVVPPAKTSPAAPVAPANVPVAKAPLPAPVAPKAAVPRETANFETTKPEPPVTLKLTTVTAPTRITAKLPGAAVVGQLPLPSVLDGDGETVKAVQKALVDGGYGPLVVNGVAGPMTRAAIMGFEHEHAMALTGEASAQLLTRLAAPRAATKADPDARKIMTQEAEQVVLIVQTSLKTLGHGSGKVDGRMGPDTVSAIRAFEAAANMTPTGRISANLFSQLARRRGEMGG